MLLYLTWGIIVSIIIVAISLLFVGDEKGRKRGVAVKVGGEAGYAQRNAQYEGLVDVPWAGATTVASVFEQCCSSDKYRWAKALGKRTAKRRETITARDGRKLEKLDLGEYHWEPYWGVFYHVTDFESGLVKFGHKVNTRVAIIAETSPWWQVALQGCFRQGITVVPIYPSLGQEALIHCLNETEVSTLICDYQQLKRLVAISSSLKTVKNVVYFEDDNRAENVRGLSQSGWKVSSFKEVKRLGRDSSVPSRLPYSEDVAVIMYTSGSTGPPKGVMITHGNLVATAAAIRASIPSMVELERVEQDVYLAYLPLANIFELAAELAMLFSGCRIGYGSPSALIDDSIKIMKGTKGDAAALKPTLMAADPAVLDRLRQGVLNKVEKGRLAKKLFNIAYKRRLAAIKGSWFGAWGIEKLFWDAIVFGRIRALLGGQLRFMLCGGAPLSGNSQRFINICMGASIGQGYGLTETSAAATFTKLDETNVGQVGPPLPCCYIKLVSWNEGGYTISDKPMPRGEVVIGGFNVSNGYFNDPGATEEVYKVDGNGVRWLYTGDIGQFHPDGSLEIIGRKKDVVSREGEAAPNSCNFLGKEMLDNLMVDVSARS